MSGLRWRSAGVAYVMILSSAVADMHCSWWRSAPDSRRKVDGCTQTHDNTIDAAHYEHHKVVVSVVQDEVLDHHAYHSKRLDYDMSSPRIV